MANNQLIVVPGITEDKLTRCFNKHYGTNISDRMNKFGEEYDETVAALANLQMYESYDVDDIPDFEEYSKILLELNKKFNEELCDMYAILTQIMVNRGLFHQQSLYDMMDKTEGRAIDPNYRRDGK